MNDFIADVRLVTDLTRTPELSAPDVERVSAAESVEQVDLGSRPGVAGSEAVFIDGMPEVLRMVRPQEASHSKDPNRKATETANGPLVTVHLNGFRVTLDRRNSEALREKLHRYLEGRSKCTPVGENRVLDISPLVDLPNRREADEFRIAALGQVLGIWRVVTPHQETEREMLIRSVLPNKVGNYIEGYRSRPKLARLLARIPRLQPILAQKLFRWWSKQ